MSVINFKCSPEMREEVKTKCWNILQEHYFGSVFPNTRVEYKHEGKDVYLQRLNELMQAELCKVDDTEDGVRVEFDSTEDAGFSIASGVYGTGMGYSDDGLTFLKPVFDELMKELPDICFDADRLDLGRVGIEPHPTKMATERGKYYASFPNEFKRLAYTFECGRNF